jgi:hypothetical protein
LSWRWRGLVEGHADQERQRILRLAAAVGGERAQRTAPVGPGHLQLDRELAWRCLCPHGCGELGYTRASLDERDARRARMHTRAQLGERSAGWLGV